jgi:protein-tyrosine phosphatase
MKILFVCSRNKWRSRTAETIFKNNGHHQIQSAGTEKSARIRITQNMINWADTIFVMESKHKKRILDNFHIDQKNTTLEVLDIPDEYQYMDNDLVEILEIKLSDVFRET